jgi:hypothetical protein
MFLATSSLCVDAAKASASDVPSVVSLDGPVDWLVAFDPDNVGRAENWQRKPQLDAKKVRVPGVYQETLPGCHGVAWYWRDVVFPLHPQPDGRYLLRFWMVNYLADVWVNDVHVGSHEGGEEAFTLDVTEAAKPGAVNHIAVRVLSPKDEPIDGFSVGNTPQRGRRCHAPVGSEYQYGGLVDSVELLIAPAVRVENLFVRPDCATGEIRVRANIRNASERLAASQLRFSVAPAASGETLATVALDRPIPTGDTLVETRLKVDRPHLWNLDDPYLYRVTIRVTVSRSNTCDEFSTRCGFRDFRFVDGAFRLNGRRVFLKCSHSGNMFPGGRKLPLDPDLLRRDLLNSKATGFNMIRFFCAVANRRQLDYCDEIGLLVYQETAAGWQWHDSPQMAERFDTSIRGMILRDRNHPSVVLWGLLNETHDGPIFRHAVNMLPLVRTLDDTRVVMLNSGLEQFVPRKRGTPEGLSLWNGAPGSEPCMARNDTNHDIQGPGIIWAPGQMSLHPGSHGEFGVLRWTAPQAGSCTVRATFFGIAEKATTDVHVLHQGKAVFDDAVNIGDRGNGTSCEKTVTVNAGDVIDFAVGWGNSSYGGDTTALAVTIRMGETAYDTADLSKKVDVSEPWSCGYFAAAKTIDAATFKPFQPFRGAARDFGALCNPGSTAWEDTLCDEHRYQRIPHLPEQIHNLRDYQPGKPVFLSEYGVASAVDLSRQLRHYEQIGLGQSEDAQLYRGFYDAFLADWKKWNMADTFGTPENYFRQAMAKMAALRLKGLNAIRANPTCVGYSMSGTYDHGSCGEGAAGTEFRDLKPGAVDALFDGFYPLRLCLFTEPYHAYRGEKVELKAVVANEDALLPGNYPIRLQIIGPDNRAVFDKTVNVKIQDRKTKPEQPLAIPFFEQDVAVKGPTGKYQFVAAFQRGGAAAGGTVDFYVTDAADMPKVETDVALWGDDPAVARWLAGRAVPSHPLAPDKQDRREVIVVGRKTGASDTAGWRALARHIARGSTAIFLSPQVFQKGDSRAGWVPLINKGRLGAKLSFLNTDWFYVHDPWVKKHPIFDGLPAGGLMDYTFYRSLISDTRWGDLDAPAELVAASINTSFTYDSETVVAVYQLGAGRFILNTLGVCERLGEDPAAERLLRNMIRYAASKADKPPSELPPQFDEQLKAMGY